jgi:acetyl-CoA carboxylase biotin carboxyl carrier protein
MTSLPFDADAVRSLAIILADTGLTEIEIEGKEGRIRVARAPAQIAAAPAATVTVAPQAAALTAAPAPASVPAPVDDAQHPGAVVSPMVGIAYLAPEPGAAPFVVLGQAVAAGQTLLLIEAMKTFNQIKAPKAGTVTRILVTPGAPVEYGQPLLILE